MKREELKRITEDGDIKHKIKFLSDNFNINLTIEIENNMGTDVLMIKRNNKYFMLWLLDGYDVYNMLDNIYNYLEGIIKGLNLVKYEQVKVKMWYEN